MSDFLFHNQQLALVAGSMISIMMFLLWDDLNKRSGAEQKIQVRWPGNLFLAVLNTLLIILAFEPTLKALSQYTANFFHSSFVWTPPLNKTSHHWFYYFIPGVLLFELIDYTLHRFSHRFQWLWRLHSVHHTDTQIDATTAYRHHPLEILVNSLLGAPILFILGFPIMVAIWHPLIRMLLVAFNHSNTLLPDTLNKPLSYIIATPNFHRVHHFSERRYTNSNYGTILSIYDHIFRTAVYIPKNQLKDHQLGLEYLRETKDNKPLNLLKSPLSTAFSPTDKVRSKR